MKSCLVMTGVLMLGLMSPVVAQEGTKATTKDDCLKASGTWNVQTSECAEDSAKMGKEEGTHEGANLGANPENDTQKVDQPSRKNSATGD